VTPEQVQAFSKTHYEQVNDIERFAVQFVIWFATWGLECRTVLAHHQPCMSLRQEGLPDHDDALTFHVGCLVRLSFEAQA
jgi:hypothetical protein